MQMFPVSFRRLLITMPSSTRSLSLDNSTTSSRDHQSKTCTLGASRVPYIVRCLNKVLTRHYFTEDGFGGRGSFETGSESPIKLVFGGQTGGKVGDWRQCLSLAVR